MIREILTLLVDGKSTSYYIRFGPERKRFQFQPTLKNKGLPSFVIRVEGGQLVTEEPLPEELAAQAREKVMEIIGNSIFDRFK